MGRGKSGSAKPTKPAPKKNPTKEKDKDKTGEPQKEDNSDPGKNNQQSGRRNDNHQLGRRQRKAVNTDFVPLTAKQKKASEDDAGVLAEV